MRIGACKRIECTKNACCISLPPQIPSNSIKMSTIFSVGGGMHNLIFEEQAQPQHHNTPHSEDLPEFYCGREMEIHHMGKCKHAPQKNGFPRTQVWCRFTGCQPNLNQRASRNSPLDNTNPHSAIGRIASQRDAPHTKAASKAQCKCGDKHSESKSTWADKALQWEVLSSSLHWYICW